MSSGSFNGPPNVVNGILYAAGSTEIAAVNATNGHILWQYTTDMTHVSPTVAPDGVYTTGNCEDDIWQVIRECSLSSWTSVFSEARLYRYNSVAPQSYDILNAQTSAVAGSFASATMPAFSDLYAVSIDSQNKVTVFDQFSGNALWTDSSVANLLIDPLLIDGVLVTADVFGMVYVRDANTGALLWSGAAGSQINPSYWAQGGLLPGMGVGDGWLLVPADHSIRAWKLVP